MDRTKESWKKSEIFCDIINALVPLSDGSMGSLDAPVCSSVYDSDRGDMIAAAPDMYRALDECDTAFAVVNLCCDELSPIGKRAVLDGWSKCTEAMIKANPNGGMAKMAKEEARLALNVRRRKEDAISRVLDAAKALVADTADSGDDTNPESGEMYSANAELVAAILEAKEVGLCD